MLKSVNLKNYALCLFITSISFISCEQTAPPTVAHEKDTTITKAGSFSKLFLDSIKLEKFIKENNVPDSASIQLRSFYYSRNFEFAWFTEQGIPEHTRAFWNLHNNYIELFQDTALKFKGLHNEIDLLLNGTSEINSDSAALLKTEIDLTEHFFEYAHHAYSGKINPGQLQWYIPSRKINQVVLLDSFIARDGKNLQGWEPVNNFYKRLKEALVRYNKLQKAGGWKQLDEEKSQKYVVGNSATAIKKLKQRLQLSGDYENNDTTESYTEALNIKIRSIQRMYGLKEDGIITAALIRELNVPVESRIRQLLINIERMRWLPEEPKEDFIIVNIPEFKLHVMEAGKKIFSMNIIAGKEAHSTVVFSGKLKYVVFSPYWNVPPSIVRNEILPAIARNHNYLDKMNMEQTGSLDGLPVIRQKPGGANALGRVKFIFPNSFNIYFHDTPVKSLFTENNRAFSHGCIRLEEPLKLAGYLLRNEHGWTEQTIDQVSSAPLEKWVTLRQPIPVFITYFTTWVDGDGLLNFRKDIYGHDKMLANQLFQ